MLFSTSDSLAFFLAELFLGSSSIGKQINNKKSMIDYLLKISIFMKLAFILWYAIVIRWLCFYLILTNWDQLYEFLFFGDLIGSKKPSNFLVLGWTFGLSKYSLWGRKLISGERYIIIIIDFCHAMLIASTFVALISIFVRVCYEFIQKIYFLLQNSILLF